ncbi:pathogenesis-related transcriptional factor and ERF protein [Haloferula helveola]|uniref:Pathogenesis-related transcriptional factor and ERF protein n=1 Tax=Haloferula helveola TaxID=490095 RepID=A0ABN6H7C7_9BACT|nr:pathogenesis-related transcriptional factor and ERF protein [Haloferula helveola]
MKSKRNLTRFTYESTAFQGWRLCISRGGATFTKYFSDKQYGGGRKSLEAAESALDEIKSTLERSRRVQGKLSDTTVRKIEKILDKA